MVPDLVNEREMRTIKQIQAPPRLVKNVSFTEEVRMHLYEENETSNVGEIKLRFDESGVVAKDDSSLAYTK